MFFIEIQLVFFRNNRLFIPAEKEQRLKQFKREGIERFTQRGLYEFTLNQELHLVLS